MSSKRFEFRITNVRCIDETEHEGVWPFEGEGVANDAMRLKALFLTEDSDARLTESRTGMFDLGSNYQDDTSVSMDLPLGAVEILATQSFPLAVTVTLFLIEEDYFGDMWGIEGAIKGYAEAAKVTHGLLSTVIGMFPGTSNKIASGIGKIASVVEPLIANLILSGGNDLFPPRDVSLLVPAFETELSPADRRGIIEFKDEQIGGHYQLTYQWDLHELDWTRVDANPATRQIAAGGRNLYQLHRDGKAWRFTGVPITGWQMIDENPNTVLLVADGESLFQLHRDGKIWRFTGTPVTGWEMLDNNRMTRQIAAGGGKLYQQHEDGSIWRFTGTPLTGWEVIDRNPMTTRIVADGENLYQLHRTGRIWRFTGTALTGWELVDQNPSTRQIVAGGGRLFQRHEDGKIFRYTGTPLSGWELIDHNRATMSISSDGLGNVYQMHRDFKIWRYTGPPVSGWTLLDQNPMTREIAAAGGILYQRHADGSVWMRAIEPVPST